MSNILLLLTNTPDAIFIESNDDRISYAQAITRIELIIETLSTFNAKTIAIFADNQADWIFVDFACQIKNICLIPLPLFFSDKQIRHAIKEANIDLIITDQVTRTSSFKNLVSQQTLKINQLSIFKIAKNFKILKPKETEKITFTSGSTGAPKGVCLTSAQQWKVASSLAKTVDKDHVRHLCVLPLSTLLENIAGVYAPTLVNGTIILSSMEDLGFNGSAGFKLEKLLQTIKRVQPHSLILLPQLLLALVCAAESGWEVPDSISFIAVGGGKVAEHLIKRAHACQLPVYEGYGLSECISVVSLNAPNNNQDKPGSTGKPLPHVKVEIKNKEIIVSGQIFLGYLNQPESWYPLTINTGDLGHLDDNGYLFIDGRKKNILVSSFGRNISPEWVESELLSNPIIQQCVVIGDAQAFCAAIIFPGQFNLTGPALTPEQKNARIQTWIDEINSGLPDYAQIKAWLKLEKALSPQDKLLTENGRPKRSQINHYYQSEIQTMYQTGITNMKEHA